METIKTDIYVCSYCGEKFDSDGREKCLLHERAHRKEFINMADSLKRMCEQIRNQNQSCKLCPFNCADECLLLEANPSKWKLYCTEE